MAPFGSGVAGDEQVGSAVAVHVRDGGTGVPAERDDAVRARTLGEGAVAVVPEQLVALRRRDVEIRVAVPVEVGCDAAFAANGAAGVRPAGDVHEPAVVVPEEGGARQPTAGGVPADVSLAVAVDDEQVRPAVVVVVQPASPPPIIAAGSFMTP